MYACPSCNTSFDNFFSLRAHQNGNRREGIQQCELIKKKLSGASADHEEDASALGAPASDFVISNPFDIKHEICRRHQSDSALGVPQPLCNILGSASLTYTGSINYGKLVQAFVEYCRWVLQSRSSKFWSLYLKTRHLPNDDQRDILLLVRKLFPGNTTSSTWCPDKRAVRYLLAKKPFWPLVTYTYTCDLSAFKVPGLGSVTYTFIDPIFAWIIQAKKVCKKYDLLFRYREALIRGERTWGSCVSCGLAMRQVKLSGRGTRYFP